MSWDDNNGNKGRNPWGAPPPGGGKKKNPWGNGDGSGNNSGNRGGQTPPEMDDIFAKIQDGLKDFMPGDMGGGKLVLAGIGVIAILWLASGIYIVSPGEHAVVQRFGAWNRTVDTEGPKYHFPAPIENVNTFNVNEIRTMNVGAAMQGKSDDKLMLTSDFNIVDLDFVIQWNISSAEDFAFNIEDPENTLRKVAQSAIREVVGQTNMFPIITTERGAVAEKSKAIMQAILNNYKSGINITQVLINSAEVHPEVQDAFQDVQSAKQDGEDVQNRAQAYREDIIPRARGAATRILQEAQAYKESVIARAGGDADRFNSVLSAYQSGQDVTKERMYIETMESVLKNAQKIILDDNGGKSGVVPYLPLNEMTRTAPSKDTDKKGQ